MRFVITGSPGAGKTTVLRVLAERGYECMPDSARAIIKRRKEAGLPPRPPLAEFGWEIFRLDVDAYRSASATGAPVFFDRGVLDALSIVAEFDDVPSEVIARHVDEFHYEQTVLVLPPWEEIYRQDEERDHDFAHAVRVHRDLTAWYERWGYVTVEVPRSSVDERADFILGAISRTKS